MATKQTEEVTKTVETKTPVQTKKPVSPLWWVLGTLVVVAVLFLAAGAIKRATVNNDRQGFEHFNRSGTMMERGGRGQMMDRLNDDNTVTGVVTKIDGNTLTVAGNGTTKQVTIGDSTEYYGAAQPVKVNDSVRIKGTTTDNTFTASQILISRSSVQ